MGLFKSAEEKAEARERATLRHHAASPVGRAEATHGRGDSLLQLTLPVDDDSATVLSQVEAVGWRLDHAGYSHEVDLISSSNMQDQIQSVSSSGRLIGVNLFRRR